MAIERKRLTDSTIPLMADDELADDDLLMVVDVSDPEQHATGSTKRVKPNAIRIKNREPGNVLKYGADPTGQEDAHGAFQEASNSVYPVTIPPGTFRLDSVVRITQPKIITCAGNSYLRTALQGTGGGTYPSPMIKEQQSRIFTTSDINLFSVESEQVWFRGGLYETQAASPTKGLFIYPLVANGAANLGTGEYGGWGGGIIDAVIAGGEDQVIAGVSAGGIGIHFDFENSTTNFAYWYYLYFDVIFRNLKEGFYMTERQEAYNQTANNSYFRAECQAVKRAVYNPDAFSNSTYHIVHQSRNIFTTKDDADATASLYLRGSGHIQHYLAHDFAKPISGGRWGNQKTYDVVGNFTNLTPEPIDVGIATNYEGEYCRISLRNPSNRSIFPRSTASAFIPELHDQLLDGVLSGSYTVTAYQGDGFSDPETQFPAMITDSTTAGIPISSDISIINPDRLFDYSGAGGTKMRLIWNANAVAGNDYVELVIDGGSPRQLTKLIMVMSNTSNSYIHVMRGLLGGAMGDNKFIAVNAMAASENGLRLFEFELGGGGVRDWIIRWIGLGLAAEINVFGLYASGLYFDGPPPVITKHGGTIYGPLIMGQEAGIVERTSTSANLGSAVHVINTSDSKQLGFRVYNTTTKTDYVAQGSNDTSTWIDTSNGTTIITPS